MDFVLFYNWTFVFQNNEEKYYLSEKHYLTHYISIYNNRVIRYKRENESNIQTITLQSILQYNYTTIMLRTKYLLFTYHLILLCYMILWYIIVSKNIKVSK